MVRQQRVAGTIELKVNGDLLRAVGSFSYGLGKDKKEASIGSTGVDGFKGTPQVAFIEGEIRHTPRTNVDALTDLEDVTVTLMLANKQIVVLRNAWFAGEGTGSTDEGTFAVRFEGASGEMQRS